MSKRIRSAVVFAKKFSVVATEIAFAMMAAQFAYAQEAKPVPEPPVAPAPAPAAPAPEAPTPAAPAPEVPAPAAPAPEVPAQGAPAPEAPAQAAPAPEVPAQAAPAPEAPTPAAPAPAASRQAPVERVEITGSSIKRIEGETALPVQIITKEEIERTGSQNVEQYLQNLGVALQGNTNVVSATSAGATTGGVAGVSLRGLGSQRTLVLIDGRRVTGGYVTDAVTVDVNQIPVAAIERIEVLKDSASAIYGSDAIGGVVNFIMKKDYQGVEVTLHGAEPQDTGGSSGGINAIMGWGDFAKDRFNATVIVDYRKDEALFGGERDFASKGIFPEHLNDVSSGNTFPANFAAADGSFGTRNLFYPNCPPPYSHFSPLFAAADSVGCRFDPSALVSLIPETEYTSVLGTARFGLTPDIESYLQLSYAHKEQRTVIQPVPLSDQFALPPNHPLFNVAPFNGFNTFLLRPTSPYYPTAFVQAETGGATPDLLIRYRSAITGNRDVTDISDQKRGVLGLKGVALGWDFDAAYLHIDSKLTERVNNGYPLLTKILPLLDSGQVNPFGASTPEVQALADAAQFRGDAWSTKTSIDSLGAKVTKDLTQLSGGPLALALGLEGRREGFIVEASDEIQIGDISGYGGNFGPVDQSRKVGALFGEVSLPVIRSLELLAAARYDNYEGVGSKTSPKAGVRWQPTKEVLVRGSYGKGFRAPSLSELFQPQTSGVTAPGLNDPLRCGQPDGLGGTNNDARDCGTQFPITIGGNPELKPETSTNTTVGLVLEPTNNVSLAVDFWAVNLKETIIFGVTPAAILADPATFASLITRGPGGTVPPCAGCPLPITNINQLNLNFGETRVRGVDVDFRLRIPAGGYGLFSVGLNGTYISKYEIQNPDGTFMDINGMVSPVVNGAGGVIPRWRHYAFLNWKRGPWDATFSQTYQRGYKDLPGTFEDPADPAFQPRRVDDYQLFDLFTSYQGLFFKNLRVTFGIKNIFDTDPPYTNAGGQNYFQAGYDPGYADPRGRTFLASVTYKFK